jgi:hypothetical protein
MTTDPDKIRSNQQNRALHLFCRLLSQELNTCGLDQRKVLKESVEIPWNEESVKESLWRPIQEAVIQKESTADAETGDYSKVYDVLCRHLADKLGVTAPIWPDKSREDLR